MTLAYANNCIAALRSLTGRDDLILPIRTALDSCSMDKARIDALEQELYETRAILHNTLCYRVKKWAHEWLGGLVE